MSKPTLGHLANWLQNELQAEGSRGSRIADKAMTAVYHERPPMGIYRPELTVDEALLRLRDAIAAKIDSDNSVEPDRAEAIWQLDQAVKKVLERAKVNPEQWIRGQ